MFVRKRASGNVLLESYRDPEGRPRQKQICNLGEHAAPEEALEAARAELEALIGPARAAEAAAAKHEDRLRSEYAAGLAKWHGGEIPPLEDVLEKAHGMALYSGEGDYYGELVLRQHHLADYADDFTIHDGDLLLEFPEFVWDRRELEDRRAKAREIRESIGPGERALRARIALLEGVVSK